MGTRCEALAATALAAYDLGGQASLSPIRFTNNAVYAVPTGATGAGAAPAYALRLHRPGYRSPAETRSELEYLRALGRATGLAVPLRVAARSGGLVVEVDAGVGTRHVVLLTWLPGRARRPGAGLGPRSAGRLGELLGRLHAFAEGFAPPPGFCLPVWDAGGLFTERSPFRPGPLDALLGPAERALFDRVAAATREVLDRPGRGRAAFGVIHADSILGNCRFRGRTPGVLDFDDCGWGHFLYDLAPLLGNLSDADRFPPLARAFLAGYRRVRALPAGCDAPPGLAAGHGLPPFHECHGLNAASACDLWLWYYTSAARPPLVYLRDGPLAGVWRGLPLGPENAVAVRGRRALLAGHGFPVRALQWTLVDLATGAREAVRPATPDGQAVDWERPFARGSCLYGWDGPRLLAYDLRHLERHLAGGGAPPGGHG